MVRSFKLGVFVCVVAAVGCGDDSAAGEAPGLDLGGKVDVVSGEPDVPGSDTAHSPDEGPDADGPDGVDPGDPIPFVPCDENADCPSGWCVESADGKTCTRTCIDSCPDGWFCSEISHVGQDVTYICRPRFVTLCMPCTTDAECSAPGSTGTDQCVSYGPEGSFCGAVCDADADCPSGFGCTEGQCRLTTGECSCSWKAIKEGATTTCAASNEHGTCGGVRQCLSKTLTSCSAAAPAPEVCDGQDNDCDDLIDEGLALEPCTDTTPAGTCTGVTVCEAGKPRCTAPTPVAEACDGVDNDCDGLADEEFKDTDEDATADCIDDDDDDDGVADTEDNCPLTANPEQEDQDLNGVGDVCDGDVDGDGDPNATDCAPTNPDVGKLATELCNAIDDDCDGKVDEGFSDLDADSVADCVDTDDDGDGIPDAEDNCPVTANPSQTDSDGDGKGDTCEEDDDQDGDPDSSDCAPLNPEVHHGAAELCNGADENCNGIVDEGFPETDADGVADCIDLDDDGDGVPDLDDLCPLMANPDQLDTDGDGKGDACDTDDDNDKTPDALDCAPLDPAVNPKAIEVCNQKDDDCDGVTDEAGAGGCQDYLYDGDGDGFGVGATTQCLCEPKSPFTATSGGDCNDQNGQVFPGATEICNLKDDDCDDTADEVGAVGCADGYVDADKDGFGTGAPACVCPALGGYASQAGDCDDGNAQIKPGAVEQCGNAKDDNCNSLIDEAGAAGCKDYYLDKDKDGFGVTGDQKCLCGPDAATSHVALAGGDCDDTDPERFPQSPEICDEKDNNCNGQVDEGVKKTWFLDEDGDGFGASYSPAQACAQPEGHTAKAGDCNDFNGDIYPNAPEACNDLDDDCDGKVDDGLELKTLYKDNDGDGYAAKNALTWQKCNVPVGWTQLMPAWDCDDSDVTVFPGAPTLCGDGKDNDCDGVADRLCFTECAGTWPYQPTFVTNRPHARHVDMNGDGSYELFVGHSFGAAILAANGTPLYDYSAPDHNYSRGVPVVADIDNYGQHGPAVQSVEVLTGDGSRPRFYKLNPDKTVTVYQSNLGVYDASAFMARDLDYDGQVEFVTSTWCDGTGSEIYRFDRTDGSIDYVAGVLDPDQTCQYWDGRTLTDLDGDGVSELVYGNGYPQPTTPSTWAGNIYATRFTNLTTLVHEPWCTDCFPTALDDLIGGSVDFVHRVGDELRASVRYFLTDTPEANNASTVRFWRYTLDGEVIEMTENPAVITAGATDVDADGVPENIGGMAWPGLYDVNGDGYPDRVQAVGQGLGVALWNPVSKTFVTNAGSTQPVSSGSVSVEVLWDLDSDGRLEVISSDEEGRVYCHELGKQTFDRYHSLPPHHPMAYRTYQWDNFEPNDGADHDGDGIPDDAVVLPSALTAGGDFYSYLSEPGDEDYFLVDTNWGGSICLRSPKGATYSLHVYALVDRWNNQTKAPGADGKPDGLIWEDTGTATTKCFNGSAVAPNRYGEYRFVVGIRGGGDFNPWWPYWLSAPK